MERSINFDFRSGADPAPALNVVDLVFLEQKLDALRVGIDHALFVRHHLFQIDAGRFAHQAHFGEVFLGLMKHLCRMKQRLGWYAPHIETCSTERAASLDAGHLETKLGGTNGTDIATRAATDHDDVVGHDKPFLVIRLRAPRNRGKQWPEGP